MILVFPRVCMRHIYLHRNHERPEEVPLVQRIPLHLSMILPYYQLGWAKR